jgi:hypothetical protein
MSVETMMTVPASVSEMETTMCQQYSSILPEDQETAKVKMWAKRYGGAWMR